MASTGAVLDEGSCGQFCHSHRELLLHSAEPRTTARGVFGGVSRLLDFGPWYRVDIQPTFSTLRHVLQHSTTDVLAEDWRITGDDLWRGLTKVAQSLSTEARRAALALLVLYVAEHWDLTEKHWAAMVTDKPDADRSRSLRSRALSAEQANDHESVDPPDAGLAPLFPESVARRLQDSFGTDLNEIIRSLSEQSQRSPAQVIERLTLMFSGPHPPPEMLDAYERVVAGAAGRILNQGLSETTHRHEMERGLLDMQREDMQKSHNETQLGLYLGAAVVALVVVAGIVALLLGHPLVGGVTLVADLATLAGVFVYRSRREVNAPRPPEQPSAPD